MKIVKNVEVPNPDLKSVGVWNIKRLNFRVLLCLQLAVNVFAHCLVNNGRRVLSLGLYVDAHFRYFFGNFSNKWILCHCAFFLWDLKCVFLKRVSFRLFFSLVRKIYSNAERETRKGKEQPRRKRPWYGKWSDDRVVWEACVRHWAESLARSAAQCSPFAGAESAWAMRAHPSWAYSSIAALPDYRLVVLSAYFSSYFLFAVLSLPTLAWRFSLFYKNFQKSVFFKFPTFLKF